MKYFILYIFLLTGNLALAQNNAKVFFYRVDRAKLFKSIHLFYNDSVIGDFKKRGILTYSTSSPTGTYKWGKKNFAHTAIYAKAEKGSFTFFKIYFRSLSATQGSGPKLKKVNLASFKRYYNKKKWIRERLRQEGYNSVEDLVKGYTLNE